MTTAALEPVHITAAKASAGSAGIWLSSFPECETLGVQLSLTHVPGSRMCVDIQTLAKAP